MQVSGQEGRGLRVRACVLGWEVLPCLPQVSLPRSYLRAVAANSNTVLFPQVRKFVGSDHKKVLILNNE